MAQQQGQRPARAGKAKPPDDVPDRPAESTPPVVTRWRQVARVVRALADTAAPDPQTWPALERLVLGLTDPLRRLDALAADVARAVSGDAHAAQEVRATIARLAAQISELDLAVAVGERPTRQHGHGHPGCTCGCGGHPKDRTVAHLAAPNLVQTTVPVPDGPDERSILDQTALTSLLVGAVAVVGPEGHRQASDVVTALVLAAGTLGSLAAVYDDDGDPGLVTHLESLAGSGALGWVSAGTLTATVLETPPTPASMQAMSGAGPAMPGDIPMPNLPGIPGVPGIPSGKVPGLPGIPGGTIPGDPEIDGLVKDRFDDLIAELLKQIKGRKFWDPEIWDHNYPWWRWPYTYEDPRWRDIIRCFRAVRAQLALLEEPAPTLPARVTWADGITAVTATGPCAGTTVTIDGSGFGTTQPPDVVLLLPTLAGCRPAAPTTWSDTRITAVLPADVASGPVGFADAGYVAAYDAWAQRRNAAIAALRLLWCASKIPPITQPFAQCPPVSAINRLRAGVPVITAFTANFETLLVLEPGVPLRLRWTVQNAETVVVERTSSTGPLFAGSTTLTDPIWSLHSFGTPPYSSLQVWTYRITATGACGGPVSRSVTVVAAKRPGLRIGTVEVTQSIQTIPETVRLVESKPTVVRVTVHHGLAGWGTGTVPNVRGRLRVRGPGIGTSPWFDAANGPVDAPMTANPGAAITVRATPARNATDETLNFLVPPGWARGTSTRFDVEVRVAGFGATSGFAGFSEMVSRTTGAFAFEPRRALQLRYIRVAWNGGAAPTAAACADTLRGSVPLLPTPTAGIAPVPGVGIQTVNLAMGSNGDTERRNLLDDWDDRHNCSWFEAAFEWLGFDCPDDDAAIWVLIPGQFARGEAFDIPSNVCMTPPSNGPYAAHELAHCLNQTHVSVACSNGQQATGGDAPSTWPNMAQLQDVPFDVVRNRALSLAGTGVFDVMTYCGTPNNTWPMPARWQRLWNEIGT